MNVDAIISHPLFIPVVLTLAIIALVPLVAGYLTLVERKVLADFQVRLGPMRVGPHGVLQPLADALKLFLKEDIIPTQADRALFWFAPCLSTITALTALSVLPFTSKLYVADVNVGLLVVSSMSAVGVLGVILGGWSSNSHYSLLGSLRGAAQLVSYEIALAFALLSGVMAAGTLSMQGIVRSQFQNGVWGVFANYGFMIVPFVVYLIAATAETNRAPFDMPEAESELVAGFHTEFSGFRWALYFLAEYTNVLAVSGVAVTLFLGGWLRPFPNVKWLEVPMNFGVPALFFLGSAALSLRLVGRLKSQAHKIVLLALIAAMALIGLAFLSPVINQFAVGFFWFVLKMASIVYLLVWFRGTFPRFRYDQLMNLGWRRFIPLALANIVATAVVLWVVVK